MKFLKIMRTDNDNEVRNSCSNLQLFYSSFFLTREDLGPKSQHFVRLNGPCIYNQNKKHLS